MVNSRRLPLDYNETTYGGGGFGRDWTVLGTWETATQGDLVTATKGEVLSCYDDAASFDDTVIITGAVTNEDYFRLVRAAPGEGHDGTPNNGVYFAYTGAVRHIFQLQENYAQLHDLILAIDDNNASDIRCVLIFDGSYSITGFRIIGCIVHHATNAGAGNANGFHLRGADIVVVNSLVQDCKWVGILSDMGVGGNLYVYNSNAYNNAYGMHCGSGNNVRKNCIADQNTTADFSGTWDTVATCLVTADNPTYVNEGGDDFHNVLGGPQIGAGTDLSADGTYAFDDDIDGETRTAWDIGFDELTTGIAVPIAFHHLMRSGG